MSSRSNLKKTLPIILPILISIAVLWGLISILSGGIKLPQSQKANVPSVSQSSPAIPSFKAGEKVSLTLNLKEKMPDKKASLGIKKAYAAEPAKNEWQGEGLKVQAKVSHPGRPIETQDLAVNIAPKNSDEFTFAVEDENPETFFPGVYQMDISITTDKGEETIKEEFAWGVLAVNTNKSIFTPGEKVYLQMAALDKFGHTICDADLKLEITDPSGSLASLTPQTSPTCGRDNVTDSPDYFAYLELPTDQKATGKYSMKLINSNNNYSIDDSFEVASTGSAQARFSVERIGATRINPFKAEYTMNIKVTANEDFEGEIVEQIPEGFEIKQSTDYRLLTTAEDGRRKTESKTISWPVTLQKGQTIPLSYTYQAPRISPQFFLLGPLKIRPTDYRLLTTAEDGRRKTEDYLFTEARKWQLASDAACISAATGSWSDTTNTVWTLASCGANHYPGQSGQSDSVSIGAHTITGDVSVSTITTIDFTATGTLNVNTGITITASGALTAGATSATTTTLGGLGTLNVASITVGGDTPGADMTTTLNTTISNLNSTNAITLSAVDTGPRENHIAINQNNGSVSAASIALDKTGQAGADYSMAGGGGSLTLTAAAPFSGTGTFTADGTNTTVTYSGASTTVKVVAYDNLTLSGTNPTLGALATINGNLLFSAGSTSSATAGANMTIGGTLTINASNTLTVPSTYTLGVTGLTTLNGSLVVSGSGIQTYTGGLDINNGGTYNNSGNSAVTIGSGGLINDGTFTSGTNTYTLNASQTINGGNAITFSGTGTAVAISGAVTVQNSNTNTVTISGAITGSVGGSTWQNNANATVDFKGAVLATGTLTATANPNTVKYTGASGQTIKTATYHHLTIANTATATDTLSSGTITVNGNFNIGDDTNATTVSAVTNDPNITVLGNMIVNTGSTMTNSDLSTATLNIDGNLTIDSTSTFTAPAGNTATTFTMGGNFTNNGTFTANTGRITFDGNAGANNQTLNGSASTTFFELYATAGGTRTIYFTDSNIYAISDNGTLSLQGTASYQLTVTRASSSDHWDLQVSNTGTTVDIDYVTASWSNAAGYKQIDVSAATGVTNGGNDINWLWPAEPAVGTRFNGLKMQGIRINDGCSDPFTDSRDGRAYPIVRIGAQCWMAENLNIGTKITSCTGGYLGVCTSGGDTVQNQGTSCSSIQKYCYSDSDSNCTTYGGLYQWDQAMCGSTTAGAQGICPSGWHLPTHDEFTTLERAVCTSGTCTTDFPYDTITTGYRGTDEGTKLKSGGSSGFNGLLAGYRNTNGSFNNPGLYTYFWTSLQNGSNAWSRFLFTSNAAVYRSFYSKSYGFSVRCLKD